MRTNQDEGAAARIEIVGIPVSNYVRAVRMVCEEKNLDYTLTPSLPHAADVSAIHPFGKVPVMRHGTVELGESKAIATYLEHRFPDTPLFPTDTVGLAQMEQWVSMLNTVFDRTMIREYGLGYYLPMMEGRDPDRAKIDAAIPALRQQIQLLDRQVGETGFLAGGRFTFADVILLPMLAFMRTLPESGEAVAATTSLEEYFLRHATRASFLATEPPPFHA